MSPGKAWCKQYNHTKQPKGTSTIDKASWMPTYRGLLGELFDDIISHIVKVSKLAGSRWWWQRVLPRLRSYLNAKNVNK
jgi:hypothetical protein